MRWCKGLKSYENQRSAYPSKSIPWQLMTWWIGCHDLTRQPWYMTADDLVNGGAMTSPALVYDSWWPGEWGCHDLTSPGIWQLMTWWMGVPWLQQPWYMTADDLVNGGAMTSPALVYDSWWPGEWGAMTSPALVYDSWWPGEWGCHDLTSPGIWQLMTWWMGVPWPHQPWYMTADDLVNGVPWPHQPWYMTADDLVNGGAMTSPALVYDSWWPGEWGAMTSPALVYDSWWPGEWGCHDLTSPGIWQLMTWWMGVPWPHQPWYMTADDLVNGGAMTSPALVYDSWWPGEWGCHDLTSPGIWQLMTWWMGVPWPHQPW